MLQVTALGILALTVGLALARPSLGRLRVQPEHAALLGAALSVALGLVTWADLQRVVRLLSLPVITLVSLMIVTLIAEHAGLFRALARRLARAADGDARRLLTYLFFSGFVVVTLFSNDAGVLIFTPLIHRLLDDVAEPSWELEQRMPFYFAALYMANLVGVLVISNPINLIVSRLLDIGFLEYAAWMLAPGLVSALATYAGLRLVFRASMPTRFRLPTAHDDEGRAADTRPAFKLASAIVLAATLLGFFTESLTGLPTGLVALAGALALMAAYHVIERRALRPVLAGVGWDVVLFVIGIFTVANGLRNAGLTGLIGQTIMNVQVAGEHLATLFVGFMTALAAATLNNHPAADAVAMALSGLDEPHALLRYKAFAALMGGALGPKMVPIGSLAALLWFRLLRNRGVHISYRRYIALGVPLTLIPLLLALLTLIAQIELARALAMSP